MHKYGKCPETIAIALEYATTARAMPPIALLPREHAHGRGLVVHSVRYTLERRATETAAVVRGRSSHVADTTTVREA